MKTYAKKLSIQLVLIIKILLWSSRLFGLKKDNIGQSRILNEKVKIWALLINCQLFIIFSTTVTPSIFSKRYSHHSACKCSFVDGCQDPVWWRSIDIPGTRSGKEDLSMLSGVLHWSGSSIWHENIWIFKKFLECYLSWSCMLTRQSGHTCVLDQHVSHITCPLTQQGTG